LPQPFHIFASHRLEALAARLADEMRERPGDPLLAERIVVPHPLMGQWLRLQLAARLGVAAHLRIELPGEFAWSAMREVVPTLATVPEYEPAYLRWRIFERLGSWDGDDEIGRYLADGDPRKRFELADRLAIAYDRCLVYRPDEIRAWQAGEPAGWHGRLWAELAAARQPDERAPSMHWIDALDRYRAALAGDHRGAPGERTELPRVSIFAVATLSPSILELLRIAAAVMDIHLFSLSPRRDFWSNVPARTGGGYYAEDNELLEAWGRPARDLQGLLAGTHAPVEVDCPPARAPEGSEQTCLGAVQAGLFGSEPPLAPPSPAQPDDSIQIHVCHSPAREVEVLHDRLLGIFAAHPDIEPADVLVLTPDLDTYAPIIAAVFGAADQIRFQIGRRRFNEGAAVTAFLDLLDLPGSRYPANAVLAPLRAASVRACFGIGENDLEGIRDAVRRSGIRWGLDAAHRTELDVPASPNHNWRHGLRRLLLGYAIDAGSDGEVLLDGITPCALDRWGFRTGAADYERLGRFLRYCELAFALDHWPHAAHRPSEWAARLRTEVLERFFAVRPGSAPELSREVSTVARLIDDFMAECDHAGSDTAVPFDVLRDVLREHAATTTRGVPRLADGVTVAGLTVGQALPAKVVCTVGMNDGAFPRRPRARQFDFLTELFGENARRLGDRDQRDDDRYAFLEVLLAARRCLLVTYTGRDLHEDKPIPPSLVVSELIEYVDRHAAGAAGERGPEHWQTRHPLQPFSPRYFRGEEPALFSYSAPMAAAATALGADGGVPDRFAGELGGGATAPETEIELEDLIRFAVSPSKHFARHRLGLHLDVRDDELDDDEPFQLDALQAWQLKSDLADWDTSSEDRAARLAAAGGLLPPGNMAEIQHRESAGEVAELREALLRFSGHTATIEVDAALADIRLVGVVEQVCEDRNELVWWRIGRIRAKDRIAAWLRLLALSVAHDCRMTAYLFGSRDGAKPCTISGPGPEEAGAMLADWVAAWRDGRNKPLPLFAEASWKWTEKQSASAVTTGWTSQPWSEGNDPVHRMMFGANPVDELFMDLAIRLLGPLREACS
jgi:exodeoxyribonuclease V gamma subunit